MHKIPDGRIIILILLVVFIGMVFVIHKSRYKPKINENININSSNHMQIISPAFAPNESIPQKYACDGQNINPPLEISGIPENAKSLALIIDDPDAPVSGGFVHWVLFNIDPSVKAIAENSAPSGAIQGTIGSGSVGYTGPCPPSGIHHYHFKLFALDDKLNLDSSAKRSAVENAMEGHILDQAVLIGLYQRKT
ncbi:MAG: YbhB/YbcL family Raf kinase inhibitor-like protein [Parcubacteria group bacterium]|jgi:hypothetical protein